jgi:deoxycytidylate deaminase
VIIAKCYDKRNRLLSVATNSYQKTHPLQKHFAKLVGHEHKEYLHAEIRAILRAKDQPIERITIERYNKNGEPMLAKPCKICEYAINSFNIPIVEYTT